MRTWWIKETAHGCDNAFRSPMDQDGPHEELIPVTEIDDAGAMSWMSLGSEAYLCYQHSKGIRPADFSSLPKDEKRHWILVAATIRAETIRSYNAAIKPTAQ